MNDESYILENNENVLLVEFPAFYDNLEEFEKYVRGLNKNIVGKVFSDHPNGGTILKDVKGYASKGTIKSMKEGTIHNLVTGFEKSFNGAFAKEYHEITNVLEDENVNEFHGYDESSLTQGEYEYNYNVGYLHGIEYYLQQEHTSEFKNENTRKAMMCILSQIDAYLYANNLSDMDSNVKFTKYK